MSKAEDGKLKKEDVWKLKNPIKDGRWITGFYAKEQGKSSEIQIQFDASAHGGRGCWFDTKNQAVKPPVMWREDSTSRGYNEFDQYERLEDNNNG